MHNEMTGIIIILCLNMSWIRTMSLYTLRKKESYILLFIK